MTRDGGLRFDATRGAAADRERVPGRGIVLLAAWVLLAFVVPVGSGWVHLLMGAGVILLIRRVVAGPRGVVA